jgi:hypothetical protein
MVVVVVVVRCGDHELLNVVKYYQAKSFQSMKRKGGNLNHVCPILILLTSIQ